jgi:hypothetical protein
MSLRIDKILEKVQLRILSYFVYSENEDSYLEVRSISHGEIFIVVIPKNINLKLAYEITYNLKKVKDGEDEEIQKDELYPGITLKENINFPLENEDLEDNLLSNYKNKLNLNRNNSEKNNINDSVKQINRLSLLVKDLPYKIAITYSDHFFTDNSYFFIKEQITKSNRHKLYVTVPLEILIDKIEKNRIADLIRDIKQIMTDSKKILDKNQYSHIEKLSLLFEKKEETIDLIQHILDKRNFYKEQQVELNSLLNSCMLKEEVLKEEIQELKKYYNSTNNDLQMAYKREGKEKQYRENLNLKVELIEKLNKVKEKENNIILFTDKVLFENILCLNKVFKNLELVDKLF